MLPKLFIDVLLYDTSEITAIMTSSFKRDSRAPTCPCISMAYRRRRPRLIPGKNVTSLRHCEEGLVFKLRPQRGQFHATSAFLEFSDFPSLHFRPQWQWPNKQRGAARLQIQGQVTQVSLNSNFNAWKSQLLTFKSIETMCVFLGDV